MNFQFSIFNFQLKTFCFLFLLVACTYAKAQVQVEATIDSVQMFIGQQAHLTINVTSDKQAKVVFPKLSPRQYLVPGVEIIEVSKNDTSEIDGKQKISKVLTLTSFDQQLYAIPGIKVNVNGKSYQGNQLALKVVTLDVDTLHPEQFFPPKDVQDNPFLWSEWTPLIWLSLLMLVLSALAFYLFTRMKKNKPIIRRVRVEKKVSAHQKALNEINRLKAENMVVSEDQKTYYTRLTDTLRRYIEERFGFMAMEMTTSEIIEHLSQAGDSVMIDELRELFQTADLVKFAKHSALLGENDMNLVNAVNFIDQTKQENVPAVEKVVPQISKEEQEARTSRRLMQLLIGIITFAVFGILFYIVYRIWYLLF